MFKKDKNKKPKIDKKTQRVINVFKSGDLQTTDPQGSYTGVPTDITEVPVQDADDL